MQHLTRLNGEACRRIGVSAYRRIGVWVYRQSGSDRLEKQPTDLRRHHDYMRDGTLGFFPYVN